MSILAAFGFGAGVGVVEVGTVLWRALELGAWWIGRRVERLYNADSSLKAKSRKNRHTYNSRVYQTATTRQDFITHVPYVSNTVTYILTIL